MSDADGLAKFASVRFQTRDEVSGELKTYKARLASLDKSSGWFYVQDGSDVYPFTPTAAVVATLEAVNSQADAEFFDISACQ